MSEDIQKRVGHFFKNFPTQRTSKGQILIWADNPPEAVFYINRGRVRQYLIFEDGTKATVNIFGPGSFFPMSLVLNDLPNKYFFETLEPSVFHCSPPAEALDFLKSNPDVLLDLLSRVYRGVDGILQKMAYMMIGDIQKLVIFELVTECRRGRHRQKPNLVTLSEGELAAHVGLARETVNRQLAKLKTNGLIVVQKEGILVRDLAGLVKLL